MKYKGKHRRTTDDPVESVIQDALDLKGIHYTMDDPLDFELGDSTLGVNRVAIECKQFHTDRIEKQWKDRQVIVVQGVAAARAFADLMAQPNINIHLSSRIPPTQKGGE